MASQYFRNWQDISDIAEWQLQEELTEKLLLE